MPNESPLSFEELVAYRQELQSFCAGHYPSIVSFRDGVSFKLNLEEGTLEGKLAHLSSTATCIESLLDCPEILLPKGASPNAEMAKEFAILALKRPHQDWISDGSAQIYCRCRTMPLVVQNLPAYQDVIFGHLERILAQLKDVTRTAIGEANEEDDQSNWYPPNAFHTYWTLRLLEIIESRFPDEFQNWRKRTKNPRLDVDRLRTEMLGWSKGCAGLQAALHAAESSTLDSDQLAWSLTTLLQFDRGFEANLGKQDFVNFALECLFSHQTRTGTWRLGAPLFHYLKSGNAYCYVFETFTALLKSALTDRREGSFLRQALRPYAKNLLSLWQYAVATQIPLSEEARTFGWSSGHRANHIEAESWATASVFAYAQCLRRLLGIWTREAASRQLRVTRSVRSEKDALKDLNERGETWAKQNGETAANQLMTLFVNPARLAGSGSFLEPDSQPIGDEQARAAILFGPPGTSKTTLSRSVADAIGWDYLELHSSHFVVDGLSNVQRTADTIFEKLMQLDRAVILFDEIDELVRAREAEGEAFGRFLTTSMLPKLAELWKRRRVIYFVATNHIRFFDPAITRAQRFDALVHVAPPSFDKKICRLKELLLKNFKEVAIQGVTAKDIEKELKNAVETDQNGADLPKAFALSKFLLMRWDQMEELACIIIQKAPARDSLTLDQDLLRDSLICISDPALRAIRPFKEYMEAQKFEQHDFSKKVVWEVLSGMRVELKDKVIEANGRLWFVASAGVADFQGLSSACKMESAGVISVKPTKTFKGSSKTQSNPGAKHKHRSQGARVAPQSTRR